ncbi:Zinc finger C2H2 type domain-containing protein [Penicillium ucsense]|uniref:Zinc finger C2H2 type domain-containing protein n=1 Tax=Penicillium ucsense TaxID=2839758 RepID=A0A8J8W4G5_9EURO|nr:Zinc finger C2H2 type domain-containing protein [Penicillium ucsense]KAF7736848.1 Zinc finger C2H2 type domain-containing protein [Penicillium ucsense]
MAPGNGRDFNCSWPHCGKSFNRKSDLCRHYRIHTNERPYHCTVKDCNKSFIQRSALTVHSRTHTGEKPHVCDHEGCQKAFSDSSSLARHRRIHTGKRPYICQEPTCERSFCRKTTLTKHQHRSHPPGSLTRPSSEDAGSEHSYHHHHHHHPTPVTVSMPGGNEPYMLPQQPYYSHSATPNHEFYSPSSVAMNSVPVHENSAPMGAPTVPVTSAMAISHASPHAPQHHSLPPPPQPQPQPPSQSQPQHPHQPHHHHQQPQHPHPQHQQSYMQVMQPRYDTIPRANFLSPEYHQAPFAGHQIQEGQPLMVGYHQNFQYKPPTRILNQPEGTDWGFLGVG